MLYINKFVCWRKVFKKPKMSTLELFSEKCRTKATAIIDSSACHLRYLNSLSHNFCGIDFYPCMYFHDIHLPLIGLVYHPMRQDCVVLLDDLEDSSIQSSHYTFSPENYPDVFSSLCDFKISCPSQDDCQEEQASSRTITAAGCSDSQADEISGRNVLQLSDAIVGSEELSDFKDFIRYLPVHLSKYILRLLDQTSLFNCRHVSQIWQTLAQEVNRESRFRLNMKKDIELMQVRNFIL